MTVEQPPAAAWITPSYPWAEEPVGGIFFRTQAQALARLGLPVTVVSPTPWAPWPLPRLRTRWQHYAAAPERAIDEGVAVVRPRYVGLPGQPSWAMPDRLMAKAVWGARRRWSAGRLIHAHSAIHGLAAGRVARRAGLPLVLTFHGNDMNTWPATHPERLAELRAVVRDAALVTAVSGALAERIGEITGVEALHLPIGCDHRALAAEAMSRPAARLRFGLADDRVVVLFLGHLTRSKGVRALVDAVLDLGDPFMCVLVGSGAEAGYHADDPRANGRLQYRGEQPHLEAMRFCSAADVLVLPSAGEGLPTVLVEAGSLRLPVIASAVGGIPELLGSDRGTLLSAVSADAIATALIEFVHHRGEAEARAQRLREHVLDAYDVDRNAGRLLTCYRSIVDGRALPASN